MRRKLSIAGILFALGLSLVLPSYPRALSRIIPEPLATDRDVHASLSAQPTRYEFVEHVIDQVRPCEGNPLRSTRNTSEATYDFTFSSGTEAGCTAVTIPNGRITLNFPGVFTGGVAFTPAINATGRLQLRVAASHFTVSGRGLTVDAVLNRLPIREDPGVHQDLRNAPCPLARFRQNPPLNGGTDAAPGLNPFSRNASCAVTAPALFQSFEGNLVLIISTIDIVVGEDPIGPPDFFNYRGIRLLRFTITSKYRPASNSCPALTLQNGFASPEQSCLDPSKSSFRTGDLVEKKVGTLDHVPIFIRARDGQDKPIPNLPVQIEVVRKCLTQTEAPRIIELPKTDAAGESSMPLREMAPGEYRYIAKVDGVTIPPSYTFVWLGDPDPRRSRISLKTRDSPLATTVWANKDDQLTVEVKVCDACDRYPRKPDERGLPVGLKFTGPENWEVPARDTDNKGMVTFSEITFDQPGGYMVESLALGDALNKTAVRARSAPKVEKVEVIQAITLPPDPRERFQYHLAENKNVLVRVYVKNRDRDVAEVKATLKGVRGTTELPDLQPMGGAKMLQPGASPDKMNLSHTYNFLLSPNWLSGRFRVKVELNPKEHPSDGHPELEFVFHPTSLRIKYVLFGSANDTIAQGADRLMRQIYPVSDASLDYARLDAKVRAVPADIKASLIQEKALNTGVDILFGWLPGGPGTSCSQGKSYAADPERGSDGKLHATSKGIVSGPTVPGCEQQMFAHEVGHNYYLGHPIDGPQEGVVEFHYVPRLMEDIGIRFTAVSKAPPSLALLPKLMLDFMNHSAPVDPPFTTSNESVWTTQSSFNWLLDKLSSGGARLNQINSSSAGADSLLLISGQVFRDGRASLDTIYPAVSSLDAAPNGPYCLRLEDASGMVLQSTCFPLGELGEYGQPLDPAQFFKTVPRPAGLAKLALVRDGRVLVERRASPRAPVVIIDSPVAGESWNGSRTIRWSARDDDGDSLCYLVQYSPDDRLNWRLLAIDLEAPQYVFDTNTVAGGERFWLRVVATDGLNIGTAEVGPIQIPKKRPEVLLIAPKQDAVFGVGAPVLLQGTGSDLEDGGLLPTSLTWSSDRDGILGSGRELLVTSLSLGDHRLALSGRDSDGNTATASVNIRVTLTPPRQCIEVTLPTNLTGNWGSTLTVPLTATDTTGAGAISFDAVINYDPAVLRLQNPPTDKTGTLSSSMTITTNSPAAGRLNISAFGTTALSGAGALLNLKFDVIGAASACSGLTVTSFRFNEDSPCATTTNGRVCVADPNANNAVALPQLTAANGASLTIPITVGDLTGRGFIAYDFDLAFDQSVLQLQSPSFDTAGTLSSALTITPNATPGRLRLSAFGTTPLAGAGTLLKLRFNVVGAGGTSTALTWQRFVFNETPQAAPTPGRVNVARAVASVSAASFTAQTLAPESIVAAFGDGLATSVATGDTIPLPTTLAGTTVRVRDSLGVERLAPLFFVAPAQTNYLIPLGTAAGTATITVTSGNGTVSIGNATIAAVAPGLFTANANGQGVAAAVALRVKADGAQSFELISRFDAALNRFVSLPIELGPPGEQVFLILFGTGLRGSSSLSNATALIGGVSAQVLFVGAQGLVGLDQVNVSVPRSLIGRGEVDIVLLVDGKEANTVRVNVK